MRALAIQRASGVLVLGGLVVATHFVDGGTPHLRAELVLAGLTAAVVVHAAASLWVVTTDYVRRPPRARIVTVIAMSLAAVALGATLRGVARAERTADTPGHFAGARCEACHVTHPFRLDAHPDPACAACHDVRAGRAALSSFEAPFSVVMAGDARCVSCHASPTPSTSPSASPSASASSSAPATAAREIVALAVDELPDDLDRGPWDRASAVELDGEAGESRLELRALSGRGRTALRATLARGDDDAWIAVMGAVRGARSFDKMGCAASCHLDAPHRTAARTDALRVLVAGPTRRIVDLDDRGLRPSAAGGSAERRRLGDGWVAYFVWSKETFDAARGISVAVSDAKKPHARRTTPLALRSAPIVP
jgi:succinate dehydrogenase hydrophobic anchor subunit